MIPRVDFTTVRFEEPQFLWLLLAPAVLLALWFWQAARRRGDAHRYAHRRTLPVRQRFGMFGGLLFWFCLILATASAILALARPHARISIVRTAGIDLVILQDGSTSMRVTDVAGNRWQRSMRFLRQLGEAISWKDDRLAMALFARIATPQVRLTKDPNTYFFFLDHLSDESPFRLEDDTSWDTNMELGIYWGLKLIDKDEEIHGKSPNAKAFVLISDGQSWSGEVEKSLERVRAKGIPIFAIGVGTSGGGVIPNPPPNPAGGPPLPIVFSVLDRSSLSVIATAGGGRYFELDREEDRDIANTIIDLTRRRSGGRGVEQSFEDRYREFLMEAAGLVVLGVLFLRDQSALALQLAAGTAVLILIARLV